MKGSNYEIRPAVAAEMEAVMAVPNYAFAENEPRDPEQPDPIQPEWTLCAFDGDRPVATSGQFPFTMRFNGNAIRADGVTLVATNPGHRRRGLVRQLISGLLQQSRDNGVPVAILWASMGAIYQRFGYGLANTYVEYDIHPRFVQFEFGERAPGRVALLGKDEALPIIRQIYQDYSADGCVLLHRSGLIWELMYRSTPKNPTYTAVYSKPDGTPCAYCLYRTKWQEGDGLEADQAIDIMDFGWTDIEGYRGIWEYLGGHDLANRIRWNRVPEDDPAMGMFLEPRMLKRLTGDGIWLRVVDVEEALATRGYDSSGEVVIKLIDDDLCGWNEGCYRLAANGAAVEVQRLKGTANADVTLDPSALAQLISGHGSTSWLARIGRLEVAEPQRLAEFDRLFSTRRRPTCANPF